MREENIRKSNSLVTAAAKLQVEFKNAHGNYNDLVSDLAFLTKSELNTISKELETNSKINGIFEEANEIFEKIENTLFELESVHSDMDETVQTIGGMEFSTNNTVDKLSDLLRYTETQHTQMTKEIGHIKTHFNNIADSESDQNPDGSEDLIDDISEFQLEFSRFQDYVQESVPRVSQLFDDLKLEEERGKKYSKTNKI